MSTLDASEPTQARYARLRQRWLRFEAAHPGTAIFVSTLIVLAASGLVLGALAVLPFPHAPAGS